MCVISPGGAQLGGFSPGGSFEVGFLRPVIFDDLSDNNLSTMMQTAQVREQLLVCGDLPGSEVVNQALSTTA